MIKRNIKNLENAVKIIAKSIKGTREILVYLNSNNWIVKDWHNDKVALKEPDKAKYILRNIYKHESISEIIEVGTLDDVDYVKFVAKVNKSYRR
ncbi:MAG: hypothetical protein KKC55_17320 [Gammaproteobacteria bacterium]|nr:hypothetical protein [Gammaproteobacteria bacterium]